MSQPLHIDPDRINALISRLSAFATTARDQLGTLTTGLDGQGEPWGTDEPGRAFAEGYEPRAEKSITALRNLADRLAEASRQVRDSTQNLYDTDYDSALEIGNADPYYLELSGPPVGPAQTIYSTPESAPSTNVPIDVPGGYLPDTAESDTGPIVGDTDANVPVDTPADQPFDYVPETSDPSAEEGFDPTANPIDYPGSADGSYPDPSGGQGNSPWTAAPSGHNPTSPPSGDRGASQQGQTPPAPGTPTSASGRGALAAQAPTTGGAAKPADSGARPVGGRPSAETPWARPQAATPWGPGAPRSRPPGTGSPIIPPGQTIPPRRPGRDQGPTPPPTRDKSGKARRTKRETTARVSAGQPTTNAAALAAAQALAARRNLRISGFDTSGIAEHTVDEIAAAVDDVLGKYPYLVLGGIEIAARTDGSIAEVIWNRDDTGPWISLDSKLAADPDLFDTTVKAAAQAGLMPPGSEQRPIYATVVHALGRILVAAAGTRAQQLAQRSLITEYRRISGPWDRGDTLAGVVDGYRTWRAQLGPNSFHSRRFHAQTALETAFAEVELRGNDASGPAKALHRLVVEMPRSRPGGG
ncbi:hypothetical protein GV792_12395 [Nocardia cyriacigeorgica]|uniref:WXG100 family type VII secretion target n=1 Tax=Nocardia cyriacigeorgica TaxID=135487 RepID=UPI0013B5BA3C|nr:WXG100 family type VII secretion target [Nocardia cyriacigeorgica]NEW50861.1 hypothetical protein [Nocardia cyriacigeorgica]